MLTSIMFENVNLYKPDRIIRLSELKEASEIYNTMRKMDAKHYVYGIAYIPADELKVLYLKIGMSSPELERKNDKTIGERITRQIAHLKGWPTLPKSTHGFDFVKNLQHCMNEGKLPERVLHKNNILIGIWNIHSNFRTCKVEASPKEQALWLEAHLCKQYKKDFSDELPYLNKVDPSNHPILKKHWLCKETNDDVLFEFC